MSEKLKAPASATPVNTGITPPAAAIELVGYEPVVTELLTRESHRAEQRALGTKRSAEERAKNNSVRDCRIRDAYAKGTPAKQIAADEKISASQVRRIVSKSSHL